MNAYLILGYTAMVVAGTAIVAGVLACRWSDSYYRAGDDDHRTPEHAAYVRGYEACSRIRDREESRLRKELLMRPVTECLTDRGCDRVQPGATFHSLAFSPETVASDYR